MRAEGLVLTLSTASARITLIVGALIVTAVGAGCSSKRTADEGGHQEMTSKTIEQVLKEHTNEWMALPGVVGTGIGECAGEPCIRVFVVEKTNELMSKFPARLQGYVVDVQESGRFRALDPP